MERIVRKISPAFSILPPKKRVAAYARVSSGKDAMLHSLSAQVSYYSDYVQHNREWQYVGVYADEAMTGTKDDRADFQRMLADCRAGLIDMIITKSISRFARNTVTMLQTVRELKQLNIDVFFEKKDFDAAESPILRDFSAPYQSLWRLVGV
jgi:DNA invertase Pin-like site-specific DNA recombinase